MDTVLRLGAEIEAGRVDPRALTEELLDKIEARDSRREIYVRTTRERAMAEAAAAQERAKSGLRRSPIDGVPLSWKDLFDTAGVLTEGGTPLLQGRVPDKDAEVLRRMTLAGTVCLGKTNMTEMAFSGLGINPMIGTPANPLDPSVARCPGGSSSGAAASVSSGLAPAAMGSDTGGSIRLPACWNGLVGLKPSHGLLPLDGVLPLGQSFDTVGPLTRDVDDAAAIFAALDNRPVATPIAADLARCRFWLAGNPVDRDLEPEVERIFRAAAEKIARASAAVEASEWTGVPAMLEFSAPLLGSEAFSNWGKMIEERPALVSNQIRTRFLSAKEVPAQVVVENFRKLAAAREQHKARAAGYDALIMPTSPITPPAIQPLLDDPALFASTNLLALRNTRIVNLLGLPAITLPAGRSASGLPVGLTLVGQDREEGKLLRLAKAIEALLSD